MKCPSHVQSVLQPCPRTPADPYESSGPSLPPASEDSHSRSSTEFFKARQYHTISAITIQHPRTWESLQTEDSASFINENYTMCMSVDGTAVKFASKLRKQ